MSGGVVTCAEMRAIEAAAIRDGRTTGVLMMEKAGVGVVRAILRRWPRLRGCSVDVLCGPGNNGGDGYVIARYLLRLGFQVRVYGVGDPDRLPPDAARMRARWLAHGVVVPIALAGDGRARITVDALFGIGVSRPLPDDLYALLRRARHRGRKLVAVDCPSGFDCDRGVFLGDRAVRADLAVTFHAMKPGLALSPPAPQMVVAPIGLGAWRRGWWQLLKPLRPGALRMVDPAPVAPVHWARAVKPGASGAHKYERGHVVVAAGAQAGAARLAARAALRSGAGAVTLATPEPLVVPDALMQRIVSGPADFRAILVDSRVSVAIVGPGLAPDAATRSLGLAAVGSGRRVVLDAGALSAFADAPDLLFAQCSERVILTPHEGEFARLFPDLTGSALDRARAAAARSGAVVLLKGSATVIARPDGAASIHVAAGARAVPQLATAGAGDVLCGVIAGTAGRDLHRAAELSVWLHVEAARRFGPGLTADDLVEQLPGAFSAQPQPDIADRTHR